jgi:hypothetical protein
MATSEPTLLTAADVAFLERCRQDLDDFFARGDGVVTIVRRPAPGGTVELEAEVVVSGLRASFSAQGETIIEAYAHLRAAAPEARLALAFRAVMDEPAGR